MPSAWLSLRGELLGIIGNTLLSEHVPLPAARRDVTAARRGVRDEGQVPGGALPRAPDAAHRDPGIRRAHPPAEAGRGRRASGARGDRAQRETADAAHRGSPRRVPDHLGVAPARDPAPRAGTADRGGRRRTSGPQPQAKRIRLDRRAPSVGGDDLRRSRPPAADRVEPARQRGQVHARGGPGARCGWRGAGPRCRSSSAIPASASARSSCPMSSTASARTTPPRRERTAGSASASRSSSHLVALHNGSIRAESPGEGQGATFTVSLPALVGAEASVVERVPPTAGSSAVLEDPPTLTGLRVLVVDDDADARDLFTRVLEQCDARVAAVASAAGGARRPRTLEAGRAGERHRACRGRAATSSCARSGASRPSSGGTIPALAVTAYAGADDVKLALSAGFQAHRRQARRARRAGAGGRQPGARRLR